MNWIVADILAGYIPVAIAMYNYYNRATWLQYSCVAT